MRRTKLCRRISINFLNKVFGNITDDNIDTNAALYFEISSLLLSQLPLSLSFVSVFVICTFFLHFLPSYSFFFHVYVTIPKKQKQKKNKESHHLRVTRAIILPDKHPGFCSYSSPSLLCRSFVGHPFLKKAHLQLQNPLGPLGPHWALIGQFVE